ncbi:hypothetical protein IF2G_05514 [Cordyceps javanica]|nr:hypothetical protein IF2G_05514 [Cordyceps javanica]
MEPAALAATEPAIVTSSYIKAAVTPVGINLAGLILALRRVSGRGTAYALRDSSPAGQLGERAVLGSAACAGKGKDAVGSLFRHVEDGADVAEPAFLAKRLSPAMGQHPATYRAVARAVRVHSPMANSRALTARSPEHERAGGCIFRGPFGIPVLMTAEVDVFCKNAHVLLAMRNCPWPFGKNCQDNDMFLYLALLFSW